MAVTLGTLTTEIQQITNRVDSSYTSFVQGCILTAIKFMETEHPYVYEKTGNVTVLASTNSIPLPADLNQLIYVQYNIGGVLYNVPVGFQGVGFPELLSFYATTTQSGNPSKYAIYNQSLYIYPFTNTDTTFTLFYYYTDTAYPQTANDSSIWFGDQTIDCVRAKAIEQFYRYPLEAPDLADSYLRGFNDFLRNLRMKNNSKRYNNRLSI